MLARHTPMRRTAFARQQPALQVIDREQRLAERVAREVENAPAAPRRAVAATICAEPAPAILKECPLSSDAYRRAVAMLPCCWCAVVGYSQHAHANEGKGMGFKTDDRTGFPLCCTRPDIEGCHTAFDQYRLLAGGREAHRAAARLWGAQTRAEIQRQGMWPARLPIWTK